MKTILKYLMLTSILLGKGWATDYMYIQDAASGGTPVKVTVSNALNLAGKLLEVRSVDASDGTATVSAKRTSSGTRVPGILSIGGASGDIIAASSGTLTLNRAVLDLAITNISYGDGNLTLRISPYSSGSTALPSLISGYSSARWASATTFKAWLANYVTGLSSLTASNCLALAALKIDVGNWDGYSTGSSNYVDYGTLIQDSVASFVDSTDHITVTSTGAADISGNASLTMTQALASTAASGTYTLATTNLTLSAVSVAAGVTFALAGLDLYLGGNITMTGAAMTISSTGASTLKLTANVTVGAINIGTNNITIDLNGYTLAMSGVITTTTVGHVLNINDTSVGSTGLIDFGVSNHTAKISLGSSLKPVLSKCAGATLTSLVLTNASGLYATGNTTLTTLALS